MSAVAIIDYGLCNIDSMARALETVGGRPVITRDPETVRSAERIILPGVGAFGAAMQNLNDWGLAAAIKDSVAGGAPLLGVCLGMQLLASKSEESPGVEGLGLIAGEVARLAPQDAVERVPHIGWNEVAHQGDPLFAGIESGHDFYFVHSFVFRCAVQTAIATTPYCGGFTAAVRAGTVAGVQYHPEKSFPYGHQQLRNFLG